jgi:hypothetical protein
MSDRVGSTSKRAEAMLSAMRAGTVRYDEGGVPIIPGQEGYDSGLPMKFLADGLGVTPGDPEYQSALSIRPPEEGTPIIDAEANPSMFRRLLGKFGLK